MMARLNDEVKEHFSKLISDTMGKHKSQQINDNQLIERLGIFRSMEETVISTLRAAERV